MVEIPGIDMAAFVKQARQQLGLSQEDFGRLLGVTRVAVNRWEKGLSYPNKDHWDLIQSFARVEDPPGKDAIKKALIAGGIALALYLILRKLFD